MAVAHYIGLPSGLFSENVCIVWGFRSSTADFSNNFFTGTLISVGVTSGNCFTGSPARRAECDALAQCPTDVASDWIVVSDPVEGTQGVDCTPVTVVGALGPGRGAFAS